MILLGYPGEVSQDVNTRWIWWVAAMIPFVIIVIDLFVGLKASLASQPEDVRGLVNGARLLTVLSWSFYPIVFIFPMIGFSGGAATTAVQVGYTIWTSSQRRSLGCLSSQSPCARVRTSAP